MKDYKKVENCLKSFLKNNKRLSYSVALLVTFLINGGFSYADEAVQAPLRTELKVKIEKEQENISQMLKEAEESMKDIDLKNVYYPECKDSDKWVDELQEYKEVLEDNPIDVAIVVLGSDGGILDYRYVDEDNKNVHLVEFSDDEKNQLQSSGMEINSNKLVSIGYENLMSARNLFVVAVGSDKRKYIAELFENDNEENKTILSVLNQHKNLIIFTDKEASYKSEEEVNRLIKHRQRQQEAKLRAEKEQEEAAKNEEKAEDR